MRDLRLQLRSGLADACTAISDALAAADAAIAGVLQFLEKSKGSSAGIEECFGKLASIYQEWCVPNLKGLDANSFPKSGAEFEEKKRVVLRSSRS